MDIYPDNTNHRPCYFVIANESLLFSVIMSQLFLKLTVSFVGATNEEVKVEHPVVLYFRPKRFYSKSIILKYRLNANCNS